MEKTKEIKQDKTHENGEQIKYSKEEMIKALEKEIEEIKVLFHQKTCALSHVKAIK